MRIGIFGGSFNPIHHGHLRAAEEVREALELDLVYFVPAASPPHKAEGDLAPAEHRLQMVRLATKGNRHFMVSDAEVKRIGRSYTVDTVRYFVSTLRPPSYLYLMMGMDAFAELDSWRESRELVNLCSVVVHTRGRGRGSEPPRVSLAALQRFGYCQKGDHYVNPSDQTLSFIETTFFPVSCTDIRHKLQRHQSVRYLVPSDVVDYIERHALY
jgi:nicotinate-nucleotide adenylyltransferase